MTPTRFPEARAPRGMVATPHLLATQSGVAALRAGGNALDAAIAAAATIAVVYPHHERPGRRQRVAESTTRGARACAPSVGWAGPRGPPPSTGYAARGVTQALPARGGPAALTVPAVVEGWWQAHRHSREAMGSPLDWKALLADAVAYAREGFTPRTASASRRRASRICSPTGRRG